ncbi:MAG: glycerol-3-phosphate acyltransferase [Deltaproteobacteria bacterium]|jgi:glycerol-3-phosphate O-acyltransferase|nr:glycerol-3-phosphate acyltransferase [Deltaproteobacteria bacterium]MBT4644596.1 glycerol-3-phosphate acyltransferase [Deltaproteobacteria bacterium]MBT6501572.1 glycerol-3-phosphate acyltransferase [Deltaproteobacteria bacterium]MBT6612772.1 glycerol-3-phosphate acyltransferase [Deltaproteobacteria bacterium]MBT7151155.1 glycerol-3-phosphate acyltransferase [Deltaproteobacteria bacterium]
MTTPITIPIWLFVLMLLLTLWSVFSRALFPGVRWFFRRRINRVIDEIASHLDIEIRPFQLTKRQVLIDRLAYDPKVMEAIQAVAEKEQKPRELLQAEVMTYAKEIIPSFNAYLYFRVGYWLAKKIARLIYKVRVGRIDNEKLAAVDSNSTVVFVMNHRSNMDYILVAFLAMERTTLSYAVGEWARIWPLHTLIRAMGAFFVRRNSGNPLYRQVLERYIHMATREGVCQAVFLEGGLSRDGHIRPPRFGLVDYMLRSFDPDKDRDIVFIPVGINYDRTIEDRSLLRNLDPDRKKRSAWFVIKTTFGFIIRNFAQMAVGKWRRFGYACVNFGDPVFAAEFCRRGGFKFKDLPKAERFDKVEIFCNQLIKAIEQVIPVLPVVLVSRVMLENEGLPLDLFEIKARVRSLIDHLTQQGAPIYYPKHNFEKYIEMSLEMMKMRHMLLYSEQSIQANPEMTDILSYYANSISHW